MWANEFYSERLGGEPSGFAMAIAIGTLLAMGVGLLRVAAAVWKKPLVLLVLGGTCGFWWASVTGHPWLGFMILLGGMLPLVVASNFKEHRTHRRQKHLKQSL